MIRNTCKYIDRPTYKRPTHWRQFASFFSTSLQSCKERPCIHSTNLQSFKESFHSLVTEEFLKVSEGDLAMSPFVYPEAMADHKKDAGQGCSSFSVFESLKKLGRPVSWQKVQDPKT